jgi:hypothetical protein
VSQYPAEPKVQAASLTAAVSGAALYLLQVYVFKGAVPPGVESLIYAAVPGALAYAAGWLAPHQHRPIVAVTPLPEPSNVSVQPAGYPPQEERLDIKTEPGM